MRRLTPAFFTLWLGTLCAAPVPAAAPPTPATGLFDLLQNNAGGPSFGLALGDLDGDGDLDLFTADVGPDRVWLNQGGAQGGLRGEFADSGQSLGQELAAAVALGDLDGDGDLDAFVGNGFVEDPIPVADTVWWNDGDGRFIDSGQRLGAAVSAAVALGDVDGDGDLDAVVADVGFGGNLLWINQGGAQGGSAGFFLDGGQGRLGNASIGALALGDLDGDGDLDVLISDGGPPRAFVNQGGAQLGNEGTFTATATVLGNARGRVALGDLDGDGDLDAFLSTDAAETVWLNDGAGQLGDSGQRLGLDDRISRALVLGDVDGDGDLDAVVGRAPVDAYVPGATSELALRLVWLNDGASRFALAGQCLPVAGDLLRESRDLALGDIDGDAVLDVAEANRDANRLWRGGVAAAAAPGRCCSAELAVYGGDAGSGSAPAASFSEAFVAWAGNLAQRAVATMAAKMSGAGIDLEIIRRLRDEILAGSPTGPRLIDFYRNHDAELFALLSSDPELRAEGGAVLELWQSDLAALVEGNGVSAMVGQAQIDALETFLDRIESAASPALAQALAAERAALPPGQDLVGANLDEARAMTVGVSGIFADDFETGNLNAWSSSPGN